MQTMFEVILRPRNRNEKKSKTLAVVSSKTRGIAMAHRITDLLHEAKIHGWVDVTPVNAFGADSAANSISIEA